MEKWLQKTVLEGKEVRLEPLSLAHAEGLGEAVADGRLWELWYTKAPLPEEAKEYIEKALMDFEADQALPFAVISKASGKVVGTTRYMNAMGIHRRLEIGSTWYALSAQRTGINTECKFLLLQHAFEQLDCIAVEFRTHWFNTASRAAIARLGAKQDGVLRNHQIDASGCLRDTVVFSIIQSEWPTVKKSLVYKMGKTYDGPASLPSL